MYRSVVFAVFLAASCAATTVVRIDDNQWQSFINYFENNTETLTLIYNELTENFQDINNQLSQTLKTEEYLKVVSKVNAEAISPLSLSKFPTLPSQNSFKWPFTYDGHTMPLTSLASLHHLSDAVECIGSNADIFHMPVYNEEMEMKCINTNQPYQTDYFVSDQDIENGLIGMLSTFFQGFATGPPGYNRPYPENMLINMGGNNNKSGWPLDDLGGDLCGNPPTYNPYYAPENGRPDEILSSPVGYYLVVIGWSLNGACALCYTNVTFTTITLDSFESTVSNSVSYRMNPRYTQSACPDGLYNVPTCNGRKFRPAVYTALYDTRNYVVPDGESVIGSWRLASNIYGSGYQAQYEWDVISNIQIQQKFCTLIKNMKKDKKYAVFNTWGDAWRNWPGNKVAQYGPWGDQGFTNLFFVAPISTSRKTNYNLAEEDTYIYVADDTTYDSVLEGLKGDVGGVVEEFSSVLDDVTVQTKNIKDVIDRGKDYINDIVEVIEAIGEIVELFL